MHKSRLQHIRFSIFFPADDLVAVTIARLCILREDLLLEGQAIRQASLPGLDSNGQEWRRLYFWRNSFKTLENIRQAIHTLSCERKFNEAFKKEPLAVQKGFERLRRQLEKISSEFLKDLRNDLGGHVSQKATADALKRMDADQLALLEISADGKVGNQHYRFATELVLQMMLPRTPVKAPNRELKKILRKVALMNWAVLIIDEIFNAYITSRRLLD